MKKRLHALLIAAMMLLIPLVACGYELSTSIGPLGALSVDASPTSRLPGDTIIQFPDPNFEAEVREIIEKPEGEIIVDDVAEITCLGLSMSGIVDLTGIEYFTALEELYCNENQLAELDISQNIKLKSLMCNINYLTALDVSHNPALTKLVCWENQLTTLDVSQNPALEYLTCDTNQLTMLDVSSNSALEQLRCGSNQLTMLDVKLNPKLEILLCDDNQLTTLDVSHNPALGWLDCNSNLFADKSAIIGLDERKLYRFAFDPQNDR